MGLTVRFAFDFAPCINPNLGGTIHVSRFSVTVNSGSRRGDHLHCKNIKVAGSRAFNVLTLSREFRAVAGALKAAVGGDPSIKAAQMGADGADGDHPFIGVAEPKASGINPFWGRTRSGDGARFNGENPTKFAFTEAG